MSVGPYGPGEFCHILRGGGSSWSFLGKTLMLMVIVVMVMARVIHNYDQPANPQQYGLPYSSVTLGRPVRLGGRPRENNLFCDLDSRNNNNMLSDLGEGERSSRGRERGTGERGRSRSLKRTESFV